MTVARFTGGELPHGLVYVVLPGDTKLVLSDCFDLLAYPVDEAFSGGPRPGKRGRGAAGKSLVVIAAEADGKKIGRIRMVRVADASAESLLPAVMQSVAPGTLVQTDQWRAYNGLKSLGYGHEVIHPTAELGENLLPGHLARFDFGV